MTPLILVADDDRELRRLVSLLLVEAGYRVLEAASAPEVHRLLSAQQVDLVLLDLNLGLASGLDVLTGIRHGPQLVDLPVVIVSAAVASDGDEALRRAGATAAVSKPFSIDGMLTTVAAALERRASRPLGAEA